MRRVLRRIGAVLWTALSLVCIAAGILVGLARLSMPFAEHLEPRLETWLAERFERPVEVAAVGAVWEAKGPVLRLAGLRIGGQAPGEPPLVLEQAELAVNLFGWVLPGTQVTDFRVARTDLTLERGPGGRVRLKGLGAAEGGDSGATLDWLLSQGSISLVNCTLTLRDVSRNLELRFSDIDLSLDNHGLEHRLAGRLQAAQEAGEVGFQLEFGTLASRRGIIRARFYLEGSDVSLRRWFAGMPVAGMVIDAGRADFRVWGDWGRKGPERVEGVLGFRDLALARSATGAGDEAHAFAARELGATLLWERTDSGWQLFGERLALRRDSGDLWPGQAGFTLAREPGRTRFGADYVRLEDVSDLLRALQRVPEPVRETLAAMTPSGELHHLRGSWQPDRGWPAGLSLAAGLDRVAWRGHEGLPGLSGLSGTVDGGGDAGTMQLDSIALVFDYPRLFRRPLALESVQGRVRWNAEDEGWALRARDVRLRTGGADARGRLSLRFPGDGSRPFIDLRARVAGGNVAMTSAYLPVGIMPDGLVQWLDRAVVDGELAQAGVMAYGDLAHWPFDGGRPGQFRAHAEVRDAVLDYRDGWPRLEQAAARLEFHGHAINISGDEGRVFDARADSLRASIDDVRRPLLELEVGALGPASDLLRFVRESPLHDDFEPYLDGLSASGDGRVRVAIDLPLKEAMPEELRVDGSVALEEASLSDDRWDVAFDRVSGEASFDATGFSAEDFAAHYQGEPVRLWLEVGAERFDAEVGRARMTGELPPAVLLSGFPAIAFLTSHVEGRVDSEVRLTIPEAEPGELPRAMLTLSTDMAGVAVDLPPPLGKVGGERVPLVLTLPMPYRGEPLSLHYGERLSARLHPAAEGGMRGRVLLGNMLPDLPAAPGLEIDGRLPLLDLDRWLPLIALQPGGAVTPPVRRVSILADEMKVLERSFADVTLEARPDGGRWRVALEGPAMEGSLELPSAGRGLVADFRRLAVPEAPEDAPRRAIDPRALPPLHMLIEQFTLGNTALGRTRVEAFPVRRGLRIDMLKAESDVMALQGNGTWSVGGEGQRSQFDLTITAENLGAMLSEFGYAGLVEGGQTLAHLDVVWPGAPADFTLSRANGGLEFSVGEGRIMPVEPGAGRIFGLFSLQALPRRLTLDFSDLFQTGLSFDAIQGSFRFSDGDAHTDDLTLAGPAALIRITGRVGMARRDYDQQVTVLPSVGNTLPLVGALAGGPAGAAAMFVLQSLFEKQLSEVARHRYAITGSWDDPQVEQIRVPQASRSRGRSEGSGPR